jgi:hypothetical protein
MAFPTSGGGYQLTDGNLNEPKIGVQPDPAVVTAAATLTAAQVLTGLLIVSTAATTTNQAYTLPTVASLEAALVNPKLNSTIEFVVINLGTSSGTATMTTNTGWTVAATLGAVAVAVTASGRFLGRKTSDTGWTLYRIA